jgi:hypothetical protein
LITMKEESNGKGLFLARVGAEGGGCGCGWRRDSMGG